MTAVTETQSAAELMAEFRRNLPPNVSRQLDDRALIPFGSIDSNLNRLARAGWTMKQILDYCTYKLGGVDNAGAVINSRLKFAPEIPPAKATLFATATWCSDDCRERQGWVYDDDGNLDHRCPCRNTT